MQFFKNCIYTLLVILAIIVIAMASYIIGAILIVLAIWFTISILLKISSDSNIKEPK